MKYLLDSHVLLWYDAADPRLAEETVTVLRQPGAQVYVSAATVWELAIKRSIGRLKMLGTATEIIERHYFQSLSVTADHAEHVSTLRNVHGDPFDRILLAQAVLEELTLVTHDRTLLGYGVPILLV